MQKLMTGVLTVLCLTMALLFLGNPAIAQQDVDLDQILQQYEGVSLEQATDEQILSAIGKASSANPALASAIVAAAIAARPDLATGIVSAAVEAAPDQSDAIVAIASAANPGQGESYQQAAEQARQRVQAVQAIQQNFGAAGSEGDSPPPRDEDDSSIEPAPTPPAPTPPAPTPPAPRPAPRPAPSPSPTT